jgi:hypothetical protein
MNHHAENTGERALREVKCILEKLQAASGLWDRLCDATSLGKPACIRAIISICGEAGVLETDAERALGSEESMTIYSEHHEAIGRLELVPDESSKLSTIVWALEGMHLKTNRRPQQKPGQE